MGSKKQYPMRVPRTAEGIRLQESRAGGERSWWAKRFLASIEAKNLAGRFGRGRNYALTGQVVSLRLDGPRVVAEVIGKRSDPYVVTLCFRAPTGDVRERIVSALRAEPMIVARLLANDMPIEVEEAFRAEGYDFFPGGRISDGVYDVTTCCSCPDYANPCKHAMASLMILCEEVSRRPATLLECRGIALEELYEV